MTAGVRVSVPATSANLGPGFDVLGLALPWANAFTAVPAAGTSVSATGPYASGVDTNPATCLVLMAARMLEAHAGFRLPEARWTIEARVPTARGLGSSSTAIVGGVLAANALLGEPLSQADCFDLAAEIEGHPDNVAPAIFGGVTAAWRGEGRFRAARVASAVPCELVVAVPAFELSTEAARRALPPQYGRSEVVSNLGAVTALTLALASGTVDYLAEALTDALHQPYRLPLIPGGEAAMRAAREAGAHGAVVSGAGPTLLALAPETVADSVAEAMQIAWGAAGVTADVRRFSHLSTGAELSLPTPGAI